MTIANKLIYALLFLMVLILVGMLTGSWRAILYPYLLVVGISVLLGYTKAVRNKRVLLAVPIGLAALYISLYAWLDIISIASTVDESDFVLGLTPSLAIYIFGVAPAVALGGLLYALTFSESSEDLPSRSGGSESPAQDTDGQQRKVR